MNASEKNSFEEQWRDAFENAELTPDPTIWATIETHLADAETDKYKRKLYVFKLRVAAAAALLILALGSWVVWQSQQQPEGNNILAHQPAASSAPDQTPIASNEKSKASESAISQNNADKSGKGETPVSTSESTDEPLATQPIGTPDAKSPSLARENTISPDTKTAPLATTQTNVARVQSKKSQQKVRTGKDNEVSSPVATLPSERIAYAPQSKKSDKKVNSSTKKSSAKNSILQKDKTPVETFSLTDEQPIADAVVNPATQANSVNSFEAINALSGRSIAAQPAKMPQKEIRWQLNQLYWDQVMAADIKAQEEKGSKRSRWQLGAGITPGSFNPNFTTGGSSLSYASTGIDRTLNNAVTSNVLADQTSLKNVTTSGISYNTGIQAEFAISERWSIQSGVQYTYNQSQIETSQYIAVASPTADATKSIQIPTFYNLLVSPSPTSSQYAYVSLDAKSPSNFAYSKTGEAAKPLNNVYQYMGIPVRMLYKVLNKKLKASVGAGVATDLFSRNRISSDEANIQSLEITSSQNSIYKNMSISGLLSVKLDYTIGNHYSIYLEPTYRRAITSFTTSSTLASYPSWWGVGTGIQYRF